MAARPRAVCLAGVRAVQVGAAPGVSNTVLGFRHGSLVPCWPMRSEFQPLWASVSSVHHTHRGHRAAGTQQAPKCEDQGCPSCGRTPGDTMTSHSDHKHRTPSSRCQGEVWPCPRRMGPDIGPQSRMLVQTRVPPISRSRLASQWR